MSGFYKNIAGMMMGVGGAQAITLLASPIIARLFTPEDFGVAALFLSIITIAVIPATLRLEHALILPESDLEALSIAKSTLKILGAAVLVIAFGFSVAISLAPELIGNSSLAEMVYLLPVAVLIMGLGQLVTSWGTRQKQFRSIGGGNFVSAIAVTGTRVVFGLLRGTSALALICSQQLGVLVKLIIIGKSLTFPKANANKYKGGLSLKEVLSKYRQFPMFSAPTGLLRALNDNLPILILSVLFEPAVVGLYAMASRLIKVPVQVIGEPVRLAFLQRSSELARKGQSVYKPLVQLTAILFALSLVIIIPLALFGGELFGLVLGEKWAQAGIYASIISPWFASIFIQVPSACLYIVYQKQQRLLVLQGVVTLVMGMCAVAMYYNNYSVEMSLAILSIVGTLLNMAIIINAILMEKVQRNLNMSFSE